LELEPIEEYFGVKDYQGNKNRGLVLQSREKRAKKHQEEGERILAFLERRETGRSFCAEEMLLADALARKQGSQVIYADIPRKLIEARVYQRSSWIKKLWLLLKFSFFSPPVMNIPPALQAHPSKIPEEIFYRRLEDAIKAVTNDLEMFERDLNFVYQMRHVAAKANNQNRRKTTVVGVFGACHVPGIITCWDLKEDVDYNLLSGPATQDAIRYSVASLLQKVKTTQKTNYR